MKRVLNGFVCDDPVITSTFGQQLDVMNACNSSPVEPTEVSVGKEYWRDDTSGTFEEQFESAFIEIFDSGGHLCMIKYRIIGVDCKLIFIF